MIHEFAREESTTLRHVIYFSRSFGLMVAKSANSQQLSNPTMVATASYSEQTLFLNDHHIVYHVTDNQMIHCMYELVKWLQMTSSAVP